MGPGGTGAAAGARRARWDRRARRRGCRGPCASRRRSRSRTRGGRDRPNSLRGRRSARPARVRLTAALAGTSPAGENPRVASPRPYLDLTLGEWLDELARAEPAPGGGSALGVAVAMAASVLTMTARLSGAAGFTAQAEGLRVRTLPLAQLDGDVYAAALDVRA